MSATYRFKWSNYSLESQLRSRHTVADKMRREAELLVKRAEQIEAECREWEAALEEVLEPSIQQDTPANG